MVTASSPTVPPYRVTLFFGPEVRDTSPDIVYCVFNVKKRSWKGGIQLVVEMTQDQVARCQQILQFEPWLRNALRHLPCEEYDEYVQRGRTVCLQSLCQTKLQLAIHEGLKQETILLSHDSFSHALERAIGLSGPSFKEHLLAELDVPAREDVAEEHVAERSLCSEARDARESGSAITSTRIDGRPAGQTRDSVAPWSPHLRPLVARGALWPFDDLS